MRFISQLQACAAKDTLTAALDNKESHHGGPADAAESEAAAKPVEGLSEVPPGTHQEGEEEEPLAADAEVDAEDVE